MILAVTDVVRQAGYAGLAAVVFLENIVPPIPSEVVLPFAGYEVSEGQLTFVGALLAATLGSVVGALVLYELARRGGRPAILRTSRYSRVTAADLDKAEERFRRHGVWLVLFGRCLPGLRSIISVPAGLSRMPLPLFLGLTTLGSAVWNAALIGAGVALGARFEEVGEVVGPLSTAVIALVAVGVLALLVVLRRRRPAEAT